MELDESKSFNFVPTDEVTIVNGVNGVNDDEHLCKNGHEEVIDDVQNCNDNEELIPSLESAISVLTTSPIEYSFGTFFSWFMPSCMDIWSLDECGFPSSSPSSSDQIIIAYGARSYLFLLNANRTENASRGRLLVSEESCYSIQYRDLVNVFNHTVNKKYTDVFRSTNTYITTVVFEKLKDFVGKHKSLNSDNTTPNGPRVFVGNSDGSAALYDIPVRKSILQDLSFAHYKLACCRKVTQSKILSAAWLYFRSIGSVVFYSLDAHLIRWELNDNVVFVQHDQGQECGQSGRLIGQLQISCLASMSAECTSDRTEHKLAVG